MNIRPLLPQDIPGMLEWMHDSSINRFFQFDAANQTYEKCLRFIAGSMTDTEKHYAVTDADDIYLGTVSLKRVDALTGTAEYAIGMRAAAHGTGAAAFATNAVLHKAFDELKLNSVYLNVMDSNVRAWHFYEKMGFVYNGLCGDPVEQDGEMLKQRRYHITSDQFAARNGLLAVRLLEFPQLGDDRGQLVVIEGEKNIPFSIQRIFYIYGSDFKTVRGQHANRQSEFVLINVSGQSKVRVSDGRGNEAVYTLSLPQTGIYLPTMLWKDMFDFSADSVLLCLSNMHYNATEYIRDYNEFIREVNRL